MGVQLNTHIIFLQISFYTYNVSCFFFFPCAIALAKPLFSLAIRGTYITEEKPTQKTPYVLSITFFQYSQQQQKSQVLDKSSFLSTPFLSSSKSNIRLEGFQFLEDDYNDVLSSLRYVNI